MKFLGFSRKPAKNEKNTNNEQTTNNGQTNTNQPADMNEQNRPSETRPFFTDKYPRKEGETRIYNLIILDESGSMDMIRSQALSGANETIQSIRAAQAESPDDNQMLCFVTFDAGRNRPDVRVLIDCEKIENVQDITMEQYRPAGMTPLFDAMGISITALRGLVREGDHVLVTVITDGMENHSRIYNADSIKELVAMLSKQGWVFTYIGANQDSERTAGGLGIKSAMDFEASAQGADMMFEKMRASHRAYYKKVRASKESGIEANYDEDFFSIKDALRRVTPEHIETLQEGQIFVFGSNLQGHHIGGAARQAREKFGAVYGQGEGLQGQSYAIPTMQMNIPEIKWHVEQFIQFADQHPEMTFLVTRVGCGIAGFSDSQIAPLFAGVYSLSNVYLPIEFWKVLSYKYKM